MIIIMKMGAASEDIQNVLRKVETDGFKPHPIYGVERTVIGVIGDDREKRPGEMRLVPSAR